MKKIVQGIVAILILITSTRTASAQTTLCEFWVAPLGNNINPGTIALPWATIDYASSQLLKLGKSNCTVWIADGVYTGSTDLSERFAAPIIFKAAHPYKAILQNNNTVIKLAGAKNVTFEGFEIRHASSAAENFLVYGSMSNGTWAENITFRNNILHDSYDNDLVKFTSGVKFVTLENNVLYNQGPNEQHMDINSATDVTIQDNIFFNDFEGSGRVNTRGTKHFIVIKDSSGSNDGNLGAQRVTVRRNIFMHYQGGTEAFIQVGNDGHPYYEAIGVQIENNLMLGDGTDLISAVLGVAGAKDVSFVNNTVVGNMPASSYAFRIVTKVSNPQNQNIAFYNNIWSDPTGTMNKFSAGSSSMTNGLRLDNNLYWNGVSTVPSGELISPTADLHQVVGDPKLNSNQAGIALPRWDGFKFKSSNIMIRQEFLRLVYLYGITPANSTSIDKANPALGPATDILGQTRGTKPDLGAYENAGVILLFTPTNLAASTATNTVVPIASSTSIPALTNTLAPLNTATNIVSNTPTQTTSAPSITSTAAPTNIVATSTIPVQPTFTSTAPPTTTNTAIPTVTKTATPNITNSTDPIFSDEFESGNLAAWSSNSTDGTDLSVTSSAIPNHGKGLQAVINDKNTLYLVDDSPNAENHYRARFYFDPNSISMINGDYLYILQGYATSTSNIVIRIQFKNTSGSYQLRAKSIDEAGIDQSTPYVTITDAPHYLEVEWAAATTAGANNGYLNFWIDGVKQGSIAGIDNDIYLMERLRLGAVYFSTAATSGTMFFDGFVSRRQSYIGP